MKTRLNRSLSSVKSLAPYFLPLRARHAKSYDFVCRCCGTTLELEKQFMGLVDAMCRAAEGKTDEDLSVRAFIEEFDAMRASGMPDLSPASPSSNRVEHKS